MPRPSAAAIAWNWVIEELADCKEFDTSILAAIVRWDRSIIADPFYGDSARRRLALRYLEELVDATEIPSSEPPTRPDFDPLGQEIGDAPTTGSILCDQSQKASIGGFADKSSRSVLLQVIQHTRDALPKSSLDLLKHTILQELLRGGQVNHLHLDAANDHEIPSKRLKLNTDAVQRVRSSPATSSKIDRNFFPEGLASRHEQQLSKEKVQVDAGDVTSSSKKRDFVGGSLVDKSAKPRSESQIKTGNNIEKPNVSIDREQTIISESSSDGEGSYDAAPDLRANDQLFLAEKLKFLSSKNPVNDDSQAGDWTQQRSCIKCDEGGRVLNCTGSSCPIAVHVSCLGSDTSFENPEDFKCPFCSYLLAASAYYEARKKVSISRKALSAFMGWGRARRKKAQPSKLMTESTCARNLQNENYRAEGSELERINQAKTTAVDADSNNLDVGEEHPRTDGVMLLLLTVRRTSVATLWLVKYSANPLFPYSRRSRLPWTDEEEAILKEAMQKCHQSGEISISWVNILEYGRHVFHRTRQPVDLKDKWRNIKIRDG
ncbi:unnamed protein product [Spirodela intermedia]|uniref:Myb-like domain-containing protein n=1 Tax=Spirodela intermedia TaxID=51605 RepID=A0A7I8IFX5_SPIIN|nr:unnamed protein product [Spirodela intermedia]CAA6656285.1 unnamed protein product [Spirodela intermedia]